MDRDFWHRRWQRDEIAFHEARVNHHLASWWETVAPQSAGRVFVPLCGKAVDLAWLAQRGHEVIGVELSEIACRDFFTERDLRVQVRQSERFLRFDGERIALLCGDFFDLHRDHLDAARLLYDRGALVALPPDMRERYCAHLHELLPQDARGLLVTFEFPEQGFEGPPFSVDAACLHQLLGNKWSLHRLDERAVPEDDPIVAVRGVREVREVAWLLERNATA